MDTTYVKIQTGLGVIPSTHGRYSEGIAPLEKAYKAAVRLDNTPLMSRAALNLAICFSRLGQPGEHRRWSALAWDASKHLPAGSYGRISCAAQFAFACIELNQSGQTKEALRWLDQSVRDSRIPWIMQSAELYKADICWLLGNKRAALRAALRAREIGRSALAVGFVGAFARWGTILLLRENKPGAAWEELKAAHVLLPKLDAMDRAEVLCATRLVADQIPLSIVDIDAQVRECLASLPVRCTIELDRLGLLTH